VNVKAAGINSAGALVGVNQNNELKSAGYTDSTGNYIFNSSIIQNGIPVNLVVTGKNLLPYDGEMIITLVNNISQTPHGFKLLQNYPNPFNPVTHLEFGISDLEFVSLKVYDVLGNEIKTLVKEIKNPGIYTVEFDGSNLSSGLYFYKLTAGDFSEVKKMTLLK
jgi:hypothetical protein